jgi:integrase
MKKRLTDRFLAAVRAPSTGRIEIGDTEAPGLVFRVTSGGVRSWAIRYRPRGGAQRRTTYGTYPSITLAEARQRARDVDAAASRGSDLPKKEAQNARAAEVAGRTVTALVRDFVDGYCKANQRRWLMTERLLEAHVVPALGDKAAAAIERAHVAELLDDLRNGKGLAAQVNRVRSQLHLMFSWAAERGYVAHNPVATIKRRKIERPRERILSQDELRAIWKAAATLPAPSGPLVRTLILTGLRRDEARCAKWSEFDLDHATMSLPALRNKGRRDFKLPLSPAMVGLLEGLPRRGEFVFSLKGKRPYAGTRRLKQIIDRESGVTGWTFHDFRRVLRSGLAEIGIREEVAERVLNHARRGLDRVYNRATLAEEMRAALNAWADRVAFLVGEGREVPNVVELRAGA